MVLPRVGYELDKFQEKFEDPRTQQEVVEILKLIVAENPEMLEHIANPYLRLSLVYIGCVSMSLRKIPTNKKYGTVRRPEPSKVQPVRASNGRQPETGKILSYTTSARSWWRILISSFLSWGASTAIRSCTIFWKVWATTTSSLTAGTRS